jgi:hypothetical protein
MWRSGIVQEEGGKAGIGLNPNVFGCYGTCKPWRNGKALGGQLYRRSKDLREGEPAAEVSKCAPSVNNAWHGYRAGAIGWDRVR